MPNSSSPTLPADPIGLHDADSPLSTARAPAPLILVVIGGLVATLLMVFLVSRLEERAARADFATLAEQRFTVLDASIDRAIDSLVAIGSYFRAAGSLSRQQFAELARPLLQRQPALKALEWVPWTPADRLDALRAAVRAEGKPDFDVRELGPQGRLQPVGPRAEYFPVDYVEPLAGNERAFGFDLGSNPQRFLALDSARRLGRLTATSRISLVQERSTEFGFLLLRPIYRGPLGDASEAGLAPDPGALRGYVLGVFRLQELIQGSGAGHPRAPLDIFVFDLQGDPGERLLYPARLRADAVTDLPSSVRYTHELAVGGRTWTLVAQPAGGYLRIDHTGSAVAAVAGCLLTVLLALLQEQNRDRTAAIEQTVLRRTGDLRDSERKLIRANHEAVQASRLKTMFLASMSHEFRTPMNAILGLLHVLGRTPLEAAQRDHVDKIDSAARRLLRLIDDILDVSRIEAGKLSVEREPFRIEAVVRDMVVAVAPKLRDKPVELVLDIDPSLPAVLVGDGMRLTQVLVNLADNAAKFTLDGQIQLSLSWHAETDQRMRLRVELRDSGQGMSEGDLASVFLPFVQTGNTHRRRHGGSGLGLAICRQLVNLMGGEIRVESYPGQGSRFWFEIPVGIASPAPLAAPSSRAPAPVVLVIERNAAAARALCQLIEGFGCPVASVPDFADAGLALTQRHRDLLLAPNAPALDRLLAELPAAHRPGRVVRLLSIGASLHAGETSGMLEKPLLPGLLSAVLFPVERVAAAPAGLPPSRSDSLAAQPEADASASVPERLRVLAAALRGQLERGDPEAEVSARALAHWCEGTPRAQAAAELQRLCANFDFREATAALDSLCPPRTWPEA